MSNFRLTMLALMSLTVMSLTVGCSSERYVQSANFDQSCTSADDCAAVREGYACSCDPACPNAAVNKEAVSALNDRKEQYRKNCSPSCWESQKCGQPVGVACEKEEGATEGTCAVVVGQMPNGGDDQVSDTSGDTAMDGSDATGNDRDATSDASNGDDVAGEGDTGQDGTSGDTGS